MIFGGTFTIVWCSSQTLFVTHSDIGSDGLSRTTAGDDNQATDMSEGECLPAQRGRQSVHMVGSFNSVNSPVGPKKSVSFKTTKTKSVNDMGVKPPS